MLEALRVREKAIIIILKRIVFYLDKLGKKDEKFSLKKCTGFQ